VLSACAEGAIDAAVALVLCNRPGAPCLGRAARAGVPSRTLDHRAFPDRAAYDLALAAALGEASVDLVVLAGFMRIVGPGLLDAFPDRVLNVHPSLLPAFPGVDAIGQALAHGAQITGCTVHLVDTGTDTGPIVAQSAIAIAPDDTRETLGARLHPIEHRTLVDAIGLFSRGAVQVVRSGGRPRVVAPGEARGRVFA
jgi:phosphoribosylglycinamide formyltransferase-1